MVSPPWSGLKRSGPSASSRSQLGTRSLCRRTQIRVLVAPAVRLVVQILVDQRSPIALEATDLFAQVVHVDRGAFAGLTSREVYHLDPATGADRSPGGEIVEKATLNRLATVLTGEANLNLYGKQSVLG